MELTSCMSTNSSFSQESALPSCSTSAGSSSASITVPGDNRKLRIGRVTVGSLEGDEGRPPESRHSGCTLTLSDVSECEYWNVHGIFLRPAVLAFSDVRRLCNVCDDRMVPGGVFVREGARVRRRSLEDDEAQTLSSQSLRLVSGAVPGSEEGVMHEGAESV